MNRGVIKLSLSEVEVLKNKNLLSGHKLLALEQYNEQNPEITENISVEFSADEVEYILDEIGIPEENESDEIKILRNKFFLFNSQLRTS